MADFNNTNLADFSGVWVFCEQRQGKLQPTVLELISEARDRVRTTEISQWRQIE